MNQGIGRSVVGPVVNQGIGIGSMVVNKGVVVQGCALVDTLQACASVGRAQDWGASTQGVMQVEGILLPSPLLHGLERWQQPTLHPA